MLVNTKLKKLSMSKFIVVRILGTKSHFCTILQFRLKLDSEKPLRKVSLNLRLQTSGQFAEKLVKCGLVS